MAGTAQNNAQRTIPHGEHPARPGVAADAISGAVDRRDTAPREPSLACPLSAGVLARLERGEFSSRRALYRAAGGRTSQTVDWLDQHGWLLTATRNGEDVRRALRRRANQLGRLPEEPEVDPALAAAARRKFGSWAEVLYQATGDPGLGRYDHLPDEHLLGLIQDFARRYQRLPPPSRFDGVAYPPVALYTARFGVRTWDEVLGLVNLAGVRTFDQGGWGTLRVDCGQVYLSHRAALVGRYLTGLGVAFQQAVPAGDGAAFRFDFYLPARDCYVVLHRGGTPEPGAVAATARARANGRAVIEIFPHDNTVGKLATEVQRL